MVKCNYSEKDVMLLRRVYFLTDRALADMNPLTAGEEKCAKLHSFGPAVREYTLLHYVLSGKGTFCARGRTYHVEAGQAFIILPGEVTTYTADAEQPWHYRWLGFNGKLAADFAGLPAVVDLPHELFRDFERDAEDSAVAEYRLSAVLLRLYAFLFASTKEQNPHVRKVENFIRASYMQPIRVEELAVQLNLDRRYLSRLFKEKTGKSVQEYLIGVRMEAARHHLAQGCSVKETAGLIGYDDVSNFSKMFKKHWGKSPVDMIEK